MFHRQLRKQDKAGAIYCNTRQGVKSVVIPCPTERIAEPLDKVDFDSIIEINQPADDKGPIYVIYFWRYDR